LILISFSRTSRKTKNISILPAYGSESKQNAEPYGTRCHKVQDRPIAENPRFYEERGTFIHKEDIAMCLAISEYGLELVRDGFGS
jgi:hypothetical protein